MEGLLLKLAAALSALAVVFAPLPAWADPEANRQGIAAFQRGDMKEAVRLFEMVLLDLRSTVGERNAATISVMSNLAHAYGEMGRRAEHLSLTEKVVNLSVEVLGERHQSTLIAMSNLAFIYRVLGRTTEELALNEKVLKLSLDIHGELHEDTIAAMNNLAATYGNLGRKVERTVLAAKVLRLREELSGAQQMSLKEFNQESPPRPTSAGSGAGASSGNPAALLFGQNNYVGVGNKLDNAINDATLVARVLAERGFATRQLSDTDSLGLRQQVVAFAEILSRSRRGVLYFAGHGIQVGDENYLVPVDFAGGEDDLRKQAISLREVVSTLAVAKPEFVAIVLDACRNNPFQTASFGRRGLGEAGIKLPPGFMIIYGASAGEEALDKSPSSANNGLFTAVLGKWLQDPTLSFRQVIRRTRVEVMEAARARKHRQLPSVYDMVDTKQRFPAKLPTVVPNSAVDSFAPGPIKLVLSVAGGSPTSDMGQALADRLQKHLSVPVTVENTVGLNGERAADIVAGRTEGTTLLLSSYSASLARTLRGDQRLQPVGMVTEVPIWLVANSQTGLTDLKSLLERSRAKGTMTMGVVNVLGEACFKEVQRLIAPNKLLAIPYKGTGPALVDLHGGVIELYCGNAQQILPQLGRLNFTPLANLQEDARADSFPPTAQAQGYALVVPNWSGIFASASTPKSTIDQLSRALVHVLDDPTFRLIRISGDTFPSFSVSSEKGIPLEIDLSLRIGAELAR